jgi:hypothetical protein
MSTIYQPIVIEKSNEIIESLVDLFDDYEIMSLEFTRKYLCDKLTDKFIDGSLDDENCPILIFSNEEFDVMLREIIAGSVLYELKEKGLVDSYQDDTTEEMFFLTNKGKKEMKKKNKTI